MNEPLHVPDDIWALINNVVDDTIDQPGYEQLEAWLIDDPAHQDFFLAQCHLHAELGFSQAADRAIEELRERSQDSGVRSRGSVVSDARPVRREQTLLQWASRHPKGPAIAIAATVLIAALVVLGLVPVKDWMAGRDRKGGSDETQEKKDQDFVAKLSNWHNDVWLSGTRPPRDDPRLKIGRRLKIESGVIEVTYLSGARVVIEGPAEFVIGRMKDEGGRLKEAEVARSSTPHPSSFIPHPSNAGFLRLGKLVARVEGEEAKGFTIDTPTSSVQDLGTEFGVMVAADGTADVHVFEGNVAVMSDDVRRLLAAGQSARATDGAVLASDFEFVRPELPKNLDEVFVFYDFRPSTPLQLDDGATLEASNLGVSGARGSNGWSVRTEGGAAWLPMQTSASGPFAKTGMLNEEQDIGKSGKRLYLSWFTQAERTGATGFGGLAFFQGEKEVLFIGKAGDWGAFSVDTKTGDESGKADLDMDPSTERVDLLRVDTEVHAWVARVDFRDGPDLIHIYLDPKSNQEPTQPNLVIDTVDLKFDRLRFDSKPTPWRFDSVRVGTRWETVAPRP